MIVSLNRGGTSINWITFKAENKWGAVLDGQTITDQGFFVSVPLHGYITLKDFEIKGCANVGISIYAIKQRYISTGITYMI